MSETDHTQAYTRQGFKVGLLSIETSLLRWIIVFVLNKWVIESWGREIVMCGQCEGRCLSDEWLLNDYPIKVLLPNSTYRH